MLRSVANKVMWVGRARVFLLGLAVILALVFGVASMALGANGKPFILGQKNTATKVSQLVKSGAGPALGLQVGVGQPPLRVNSSAKVSNLNADKLDGKDSSTFVPANRVPMWVVVNHDGTIARKSPEVSGVGRPSTGNYIATFNRNVDRCAFAATNYVTPNNSGPISAASRYESFAGPDVYVLTYGSSGTTLVDRKFSLVVTC